MPKSKDPPRDEGNIPRGEVLKHLTGKSARLTVLLTDCCNSKAEGVRYWRGIRPYTPPETISPLFAALFLRPKGVVDLTASKIGEYGMVDPTDKTRGSCFTYPLAQMLEEKKDAGSMTWPKFVDLLKPKVDETFHDWFPDGYPGAEDNERQMHQTVLVYGRLPTEVVNNDVITNPQRPRFGAQGKTTPDGGVVVVKVAPGSPAQRRGSSRAT